MISIETSPVTPDVPRRIVKLEIAKIPVYTQEVVSLKNNYSVLNGTNNVIVTAESISEILADKEVGLPTSFAKLDPRMVNSKINNYGLVEKSAHEKAFGMLGYDTYLGNTVAKLFQDIKPSLTADLLPVEALLRCLRAKYQISAS